MQVRKWLNWGSKSTSDGDYPHPETTSPEALSRNPETPESAAEFLNGLDLDLMRDWAKQLYMRAKSETLEEVVADRLLLALDGFEELRTRTTELDDRLMSQHHATLGALMESDHKLDDMQQERNEARDALAALEKNHAALTRIAETSSHHMTEYKNALLQISTGVCERSKMFTGACPAGFPNNPTSWCGACLSRQVLKQFDEKTDASRS